MEEEKTEIIRCVTIIEILGKPKEHVEKSMQMYLDKIKEESYLSILKQDVAEAKEQEKMFSTFAEIEMVVKGVSNLIGFCFDYMPSSIEILKPEELKLKDKDIQNMLNDLQARLHNTDMVAKKQKFELDLMKRSLNTALKNMISLTLAAKKNLNKQELSKFTGIAEDQLSPFLDALIKEGYLKKEEDLYSLNK